MITIRFFKTRREAEKACMVLKDAGFHADITEDNFYGVPIQEYSVPARFRLNVLNSDFARVTEFLAKKVKPRRIS